MHTSRTLTAIALILLLTPAAGLAQTPTFSRTDYLTSDAPRGIAAGDFNRDGATDLAVVNTGRKSVAVLMNEKAEGFVQRYEIVLGGGPFEVVAADVNNDAVLDLVVANADLNTIDIVRGRVAGGFEAPEHIAAAGFPRGVAVADLDFDGDQDIVYTQYDLDRVQILHGDGTGHFTALVGALPTGPRPQGVVIGDFMGCCRRDIAVANTTVHYVTVLRQDDSSTFHRVDISSPVGLNVLASGDFDKDGHLDLAGVSSASNAMIVFRDTGSGFAAYSSYPTGSSPRGLAAVDLNGDGWLDLVVANRTANNVGLYMARTTTPGWFAPPVTVAAGNGSRGVVSGDFNLDGHADLATVNEFGDSVTMLTNVVAAPSGPFWELRALTTSDTFSSFVQIADFNGNGKPDILRTNGVLLDGTTLVPLSPGGNASRSILSGAIGDVNADGRLDVVLTAQANVYPQPVTTELYLGDGTGGFTYSGAFGSFGYVYATELADVNNDRRDDLIAVSSTSSGQTGRIDVLISTGSGFTQQPVINTPSVATGLAVADFDRNGRLDLAVAYGFNGYGVQLLSGNGTGSFTFGALLSTARRRWNVQAVDVNRDGIVDLVSGGDGPVTVWLGAANGTFGEGKDSDAEESYDIAVADFTGDGHVDVIAARSGLMRGTGDGRFSAPEPLNVSFFDATPVDYDRDGRMDLVMVNYWHTMVLYSRATRGPNIAPVAIAGPDYTIPYDRQFDDESCEEGPGPSYDPNLDPLTFEWRDESGRIVGRQETLCPGPLPSGTYTFTLFVHDGRGGAASDSKTITIEPLKESVGVVGYNADPHGAWRQVADATAASGFRLWHPDAGAAKLNAALASPTNYFETFLLVDPAQTYKLWVRLKAQNDSWANDSLFVQFEGGAVVGGTTHYASGTTDALDINLEECSGCGVSGWGWRDERWGTSLTSAPVLLRFSRADWVKVRIQTREDGVSIDQIVLSSEKYLKVAPGPPKRDNTLLPQKP